MCDSPGEFHTDCATTIAGGDRNRFLKFRSLAGSGVALRDSDNQRSPTVPLADKCME
jgi:hypothetical protein